jgi:hypothetical protein
MSRRLDTPALFPVLDQNKNHTILIAFRSDKIMFSGYLLMKRYSSALASPNEENGQNYVKQTY